MARGEWNVARNGQFGQLTKSAGFRRNPQQHAGIGANSQEKAPTENSWGLNSGGGMVPRIKRLLKVRNRSAAGSCEPLRTQSKSPPMPRPAADIQAGFRRDWSPARRLNLVCFPSPVQFLNAELNPRPSDRHLPLPQLANGLRQTLLEQGVEVLVGRLGRVLQ